MFSYLLHYFQDKLGVEEKKRHSWSSPCPRKPLPVCEYLIGEFKLAKNDFQVKKYLTLELACKGGYLPIVKHLIEEFGLEKSLFKNSNVLKAAYANKMAKIVQYLKEKFELQKEDLIALK